MDPVDPEDVLSQIEFWREALEKGNEAHQVFRAKVRGIPGVTTDYHITTGLQRENNLGYATPTGQGYADVVYIRGNTIEVYELKPYTPYSIALGNRQLDAYVRAIDMNVNTPGIRVRRGESLLPRFDSITPVPSTMMPGQYINFFTDPSQPGMVFYEYIRPPRPVTVEAPERKPISPMHMHTCENEISLDLSEEEAIALAILLSILARKPILPDAVTSGFLFMNCLACDHEYFEDLRNARRNAGSDDCEGKRRIATSAAAAGAAAMAAGVAAAAHAEGIS